MDELTRMHRDFLKDSIRLRFDFTTTGQSRGLPPPPLQKPHAADARTVALPGPEDFGRSGAATLISVIAGTFSTFNQPEPEPVHKPILKVLSLGGGGCNAVARMMELGIRDVHYIAANTDHQALEANPAPVKIQLGPKVTRGLGAGGDPRIGEEAAKESARELAAA